MALIEKFYQHKSSQSDVVKNIIRNLMNVLNTRKNYGAVVRELGIGDYNAHLARKKIVQTIIEEISANIELFEPRVKLNDIHEVDSDTAFRLRFELKCDLLDSEKPLFIIFDSILNNISVED